MGMSSQACTARRFSGQRAAASAADQLQLVLMSGCCRRSRHYPLLVPPAGYLARSSMKHHTFLLLALLVVCAAGVCVCLKKVQECFSRRNAFNSTFRRRLWRCLVRPSLPPSLLARSARHPADSPKMASPARLAGHRDLAQIEDECGERCGACPTLPACKLGKPKARCCWTPTEGLAKPKPNQGVCTDSYDDDMNCG